MATIRLEIGIVRSKEFVWNVVRDVGAIHKRLVPGFVLDCKSKATGEQSPSEMDWLYVNSSSASTTKPAGTHGRLAEGRLPTTMPRCRYSQKAIQSRVVWIADLMPNEAADAISEMIGQALKTMKETLESSSADDAV